VYRTISLVRENYRTRNTCAQIISAASYRCTLCQVLGFYTDEERDTGKYRERGFEKETTSAFALSDLVCYSSMLSAPFGCFYFFISPF
jgi:hypothetical protein